MTKAKCLACYADEPAVVAHGYHERCSRRLFGSKTPPTVDFGSADLEGLAKKALSRHLGVTGVQAKVSVDLEKKRGDPEHRLKITGLWGVYILKPGDARFPELPAIEDATMRMAEAAGIRTAEHGLIRLKSGELAYLTRRFDRRKKGKSVEKAACEDFCQLSGLLTERKYKTSNEKAGKVILDYSANPGLDAIRFFDLLLFAFITGNADMHLKNFSLLENEDGDGYTLSPAYDLVSTKLLPIRDPEETALTINGKKAKLRRADFEKLGRTLGIPDKARAGSFQRAREALPAMRAVLERSFLSPALRKSFAALLEQRAKILA